MRNRNNKLLHYERPQRHSLGAFCTLFIKNITYRNSVVKELTITEVYNKSNESWNSTSKLETTVPPGTYYISYGVTKISGEWGQTTSLTFNGTKINYSNNVGKTYTFEDDTTIVGKCVTSACRFSCSLRVLKIE